MTRKTEKLFPDAYGLDKAIALLNAGELVAIPTETVYGLAAVALDANAATGIFAAKERPAFDPLIVHVPRAWQSSADLIAANIFSATKMGLKQKTVIDALIRAFWPGPLTIVAPKSEKIPDVVTSGLPTVGARMPDHPVTQVLLQRLGQPLAAPSANRFGRISPTTADHVLDELDGRIAAVLDGGPCDVGVESTIVAVGQDGSLTILRPGGVTIESLRHALTFELHSNMIPIKLPAATGESVAVQAPGMMDSHYAPRKSLFLMLPGTSVRLARRDDTAIQMIKDTVSRQRADALRIGYLVPTGSPELHQKSVESALGIPVTVKSLSPKGDMVEAARNLFGAMRSLDDDSHISCILAESCPDDMGLAFAINDRLKRAASRSL